MADELISEGSQVHPNQISLLTIIKAWDSITNKEFPTRFTNVNTLLSDTIEPMFENITGDPYSNEELGAILTELTKQIMLIKSEIYNQHLFNANLIFALLEDGINVEEKILINELEYIK